MFRNLFYSVPTIRLGRWNYSNEQLTNIKIYWANMDHCGTCDSVKKLNNALSVQTKKDKLILLK
jgi:hypothetical protein